MNTKDDLDGDRHRVWHPYTQRSAVDGNSLPMIVRGEGVYLYDSQGHRYVDAISSWWSCNLGHNHPRLVEAIIKQARELQHSILGNLSHPRAVELAGKLADLFPSQAYHVLFASDGSSAIEAALKIAIQYWHNIGHPEHNRFVSLENAYHGDTLGSVAVGYIDAFHSQFKPVLFPVHRAESPCCGTCAYRKEPASCSLECFTSMEKIIQGRAHELAAVIIEPICQGAGGMRIYSPRYVRRLHDLCREKDIPLILDEIAVGFGRTGTMFALEHADIEPDIVCLGKGLSGGYLPISATIVRDSIYETFTDHPEDRSFYHGHTFAGNPIAAAAAVETLRIYQEDRIVERARQLGEVLEAEMQGVQASPGVLDVRCLGMIAAVELGAFPGDPAGAVMAQRIRERLLVEGILIRPLHNVVYLMLPLVTPRDVLIHVVKNLRETVRDILSDRER